MNDSHRAIAVRIYDQFRPQFDAPEDAAMFIDEVAHAIADAALSAKDKAAITHIRERLACFGAEIEARAADLARPKGGMIVPFHGDFASAPPSMIERLRWWHRDLLEALDAAERSEFEPIRGAAGKAADDVLRKVLDAAGRSGK
jgi:hypothetical protein